MAAPRPPRLPRPFAVLARLGAAFTCAALALGPSAASACTIAVLVDADRALFCNNEDWSDPAARLWFVPAGPGHLGRASLGFDDGWTQGGLNTAGLAFDWVAVPPRAWPRDPALRSVRGNPAERMLETCSTVAEAIAFFRTHWEPGFARGRLLVADRTGASALIGARDGRLHVESAAHSRGFGYGGATLDRHLAATPAPTVDAGRALLAACRQDGATPTRYANLFDLRRGQLTLWSGSAHGEPVALDLAAELARGPHVYDLAHLRTQVAAPPRPLPPRFQRFYLDAFPPLADQDAARLALLRRLLDDAARGTPQAADYTAAFWRQVSPARAQLAADLRQLGPLAALVLVAPPAPSDPARTSWRCIADYPAARVLQRYEFDPTGRVAAITTEFVERTAAP